MIASTQFAQESIPKQKELLDFGNLKISKVKRTGIEFVFELNGLENAIGKYSTFNKRIEGTQRKEIVLAKGQKSIEKLSIENFREDNINLLSINVDVPDAPVGYKKSYYKHYYIKKVKNEYQIIDPMIVDQKSIKKIGEDIKILQAKSTLMAASQNYKIKIAGKILIDGIQKGLYGNSVVLWFRNTNKPDEWYHPVFGNQQNIHYDILDSQGNYQFDFNFSGDLSSYNQAIILVNTVNAAVCLPAPSNGYKTWESNGYKSYFNEAEGVIIELDRTNPNVEVTKNGLINRNSGEILRYMMLARELSIKRYNGNCPFNIPSISASLTNLSVAGQFVVSWSDIINGYVQYIQIDPSYTDFSTVSHEYGHYINYLMWGRVKFCAAPTEIKEGWAIFYSFATRNYGNKVYGDYFDNYDDNTEIAPFYKSSTRYDNIRYAYCYYNKPEYAAVACYIWNAYDSYHGGDFEHNMYDLYDNDDISDQATSIFEAFRQLPLVDRNYLHYFFNNKIGSNYNFACNALFNFVYNDLYNIPAQKMQSAQIKNFSGSIVNSNQIDFSWATQSYSYPDCYQNKETGYKLYYKNGTSWQLITTLTNNQNNYSYNAKNVNREYKLTSYNLTGESSIPLYIYPYVDLSASIKGHVNISRSQPNTWMCNACGGKSPYSYQWEIKKNSYDFREQAYPSDQWLTVGNNSSNYTKPAPNNGDYRGFELRCTVTDNSNSKATSNIISVNYNVSKEMMAIEVNNKSKALPQRFSISNFPNPFNPTTKIEYQLPEESFVEIIVVNSLGQKVKQLVSENQDIGYYTIQFDGSTLPSGVYYCSLKAGTQVYTKQMVLIK